MVSASAGEGFTVSPLVVQRFISASFMLTSALEGKWSRNTFALHGFINQRGAAEVIFMEKLHCGRQ